MGEPSQDRGIPLPCRWREEEGARWEAANAISSPAADPRLCGPLLGPCGAGRRRGGMLGGGREGWGRCALGEHNAQLGTVQRPRHGPFRSQLRPRAPAQHAAAGGALPQPSVTQRPPKAPPQTPTMGVPKATSVIFPPPHTRGCRDPTLRPTRPGGGQGPCQGEPLPSPLPPLTLFGWTEGCLGESFSTLFHIHNGLNIGEQSGTWRAKPSPWSEPMTSPPR